MCLSHLIYTVRPCLIHNCHAMPMPCYDHAVLLKAIAQHSTAHLSREKTVSCSKLHTKCNLLRSDRELCDILASVMNERQRVTSLNARFDSVGNTFITPHSTVDAFDPVSSFSLTTHTFLFTQLELLRKRGRGKARERKTCFQPFILLPH